MSESEKLDYLVATPELEHSVNKLRNVRRSIDELTKLKEEFESEIKAALGEAQSLFDEDGTCMLTYKRGESVKRFDAKWLKEQDPATYEKYIVESPGNRTFLLKKVD